MKGPGPETAPLRVCVIAGRRQLGWPSLRFLQEGLTGSLDAAGLFAAPERGAAGPRGLSALAAAERAVFAPKTGGACGARDLPRDPADIPDCDVIVDFRAGPVAPELAQRARFGLWQLSCHAVPDVAAAVMRGASAMTCAVICTAACGTGGASARLLSSAVVQTKVTVTHSQAFASEKTVQLVLRDLRRLALTRRLPEMAALPDSAEPPDLRQLPGYAGRVAARAAVKLRARLRPPHPQPFALRTGRGSLADFDPAAGRDIPLPPDTFCADPFLIEHGGGIYCFYEEFPYSTRRGHITAARLTGDGAEVIGPALAAPHHLSFPYLFEHGGDVFMMPETIQADRIEVWRCVEFPLKWELHATALEGQRLGDPVLFRQGSSWWLFANSCHDSFGDFSSELSLFRTSGPDLAWVEPHPLNPVVIGSDVARSAGRVFEQDGHLYRLSQDNSGAVYGYGLNLMEISELTETGYSERRVRHVTPDQIPGAIGCHHADAAGGMFVVDVRWP